MKRDNTSKEKIEAIMKNQWADSKKVEASDFVIVNNHLNDTLLQVKKVHQKILQNAQ